MTSSELPPDGKRAQLDLFLVSILILFLELACIRWFPAHTLFLSFFTNTVLLACFLGMSVGCLCATSTRSLLSSTPVLLGLGLLAGFSVERLMGAGVQNFVDVGNQASPQLVFFGAEYHTDDLAKFRIPVEVINGFFFLIIALTFVGPGQLLGQSLGKVPDRVRAYTINILGSLLGIVLFAGFSALHLSPFWWFLPVVLGLAYFLVPRREAGQSLVDWAARPLLLACIPIIAGWNTGTVNAWSDVDKSYIQRQSFWSPYYRIDFVPALRSIDVNLIGHQTMVGRTPESTPGLSYALPHALKRDSGGRPFENILVIGAGSGNDVSRALQWGAKHIDAVEIDPVIYEIGKRNHPDRPYDDPRVTVHLDDGRNFLRSTKAKYDLVVYALVDSLVLHSSYSNIRLESYLFTKQAFEDVRRCLKPDGVFAMYNTFRQGWIVARLHNELEAVFGSPPFVMGLPYQAEIGSGEHLGMSFTLFLSGDTKSYQEAFARSPEYWLKNVAPSPDPTITPNGFDTRPPAGAESSWSRFGPARVVPPAEPLRLATDDWPFLYLRSPMIPDLTVRGMVVVGGLSLLLLYLLRPKSGGATSAAARGALGLRMFFLGAGFMLVETKAVVHMALLFGSTWIVNSIVFFAVLVMILVANLFVLRVRPQNLMPYYLGLFVAVALNVAVPLDAFLGMGRAEQVTLSCLLVSAPILFAGVIFAVSFGRVVSPDRAFGFNIAGAMLGGLAENLSMLIGFQSLLVVAGAFYAFSALGPWGDRTPTEESSPSLDS